MKCRAALHLGTLLWVAGLAGCSDSLQGGGQAETGRSPDQATALSPANSAGIAYEKFTLGNGLDVIFHIDRSDPVAAVVLTAHVGSARELPGRTGFAHLFEHLLFLESENLGKGGLDAMSARIGGSGANGSTSRDRTNYLQTVPNDALEKMLWAEADKLGWFINTVTEPVLAKEKEVVKNEKRQSYDNQPYGHTSEVITAALFPSGHPYSWEVIGTLEDIQNATLDDVKQFFNSWYTPNNVTLSIAGDFDTAQARLWVEKYFNEIPRGPDITAQLQPPVTLAATKSFYHEDNYAQLPELTLVWPTVPANHPDAIALDVLAGLLAEGKSAPLNEVLVDESKLTGAVDMFSEGSELSGEMYLVVRAFDGVDLDTVQQSIESALARFEREGIAVNDLLRIRTDREVGLYNNVATVLGKAVQLGELNAVYRDPERINTRLAALQALTAEDVMRVYDTYIKGKPHVATSFVPRGQLALAREDAVAANIVEEPIIEGAEEIFDASVTSSYQRTPSTFDRTQEPPYGPKPLLQLPAITESVLGNGLRVYASQDQELPLVQFELAVDGGLLLEDAQTPGVANFLAEVLDKGTATRTTAELEEALALLGAQITVSSGTENFVISGRTLARNFAETMALLTEMLLQPRWDAGEIELARARITADLQDLLSSPTGIADRAYMLVTYGADHVFARDVRGTLASVAAMSVADLQRHYRQLSPALSSFRVVGAVDAAQIEAGLAALVSGWTTAAPTLPQVAAAPEPEGSTLYFYDMPGAAQSVLRFGHPGPLRTSPDYYPAQVLNYRLGGGGFASRLTQELREAKGYTYGINSRFTASARQGGFLLSSSVRSNVTLEAVELTRALMRDYGATFATEDLDVSKSFLLKSQARAFESLQAKLRMLGEVADYQLPHDYVLQQGAIAEAMTVEQIQALAARYLRPDAMNYVIVGDAATQLPRLRALGLPEPVLINDLLR